MVLVKHDFWDPWDDRKSAPDKTSRVHVLDQVCLVGAALITTQKSNMAP